MLETVFSLADELETRWCGWYTNVLESQPRLWKIEKRRVKGGAEKSGGYFERDPTWEGWQKLRKRNVKTEP